MEEDKNALHPELEDDFYMHMSDGDFSFCPECGGINYLWQIREIGDGRLAKDIKCQDNSEHAYTVIFYISTETAKIVPQGEE